MSLSSFFSSFLPVAYADAPAETSEERDAGKEQPIPDADNAKDDASKDEPEDKDEPAEEPAAAEEEEEEPEDPMPALREECQQTGKCAPLTKHFQHCQEKVESGEGFKHEDCVEELMMHCVDGCVAPKLFAKLK